MMETLESVIMKKHMLISNCNPPVEYNQCKLHVLPSIAVAAAAVAPVQQLHEEWYV